MVLVKLLSTFSIPIAIWALRAGYVRYRSVRTTYKSNKNADRAIPRGAARALNLLFFFAVLVFAASFSRPENIFRLTDTRLQTPIDVVLNRIKAKRPLTPDEEALRPKLLSKESRLIYFAYGPRAILDCAFCDSSDPTTYLIYALPSILAPHILNAVIFGVSTSSFFAGKEVNRWRTTASAFAVALALLDIYCVGMYTVTDNLQATKTEEIDFFYWRMKTYRPLAIAAFDCLLGFVMWLSATDRLFRSAPTTRERLETAVSAVELKNARTWAVGCIRNTTARSKALTDQTRWYWDLEKEIYEDREVVDALNSALARANINNVEASADVRAGTVIGAIQTIKEMPKEPAKSPSSS